MKSIKSRVQNYRLLRLVALFTMILGSNIFPMRMPEMGKRAAESYIIKQQRKTQYFIYEMNDINKGIWVDKQFVKDNCQSIKNMVNDIGEDFNEIPLNFPLDTIQLVFDILNNKIDINNLSINELIMVANVFNFLAVSPNKMNVVLMKVKSDIVDKSDNKNINEQLKQLHPDMQKLLMVEPTINCLKNNIIKKYAKTRKKALVGHPISVNPVAFSPDGTKIVSGGMGGQNNIIVWDISDPKAITHQALIGHPNRVTSVAFSPDGTKIVSGFMGGQNNLIVWDISDPNTITHQALVGHPSSILSVAFSPDGTKIVSGCSGDQNSLILWNISNPNAITHQPLIGTPGNVKSVAFSPDGTKIVSGCPGLQNNVIVWDISDPNAITYQALVGHPGNVLLVAFSPDGTKIVSGCLGTEKNVIVWNISDHNTITHQALVGHPGNVTSVAFSPDGTKIVSGCLGDQNNLIVWDISNPNTITHQALVGYPSSILSVAFSPDGTKIVSGGLGPENNLMVWTLLTDQEELLLKELKQYTVDQIRLIYTFCLKALKGETISLKSDSEEYAIFMTLPENMQKLLQDLFFSKGWFSGWW